MVAALVGEGDGADIHQIRRLAVRWQRRRQPDPAVGGWSVGEAACDGGWRSGGGGGGRGCWRSAVGRRGRWLPPDPRPPNSLRLDPAAGGGGWRSGGGGGGRGRRRLLDPRPPNSLRPDPATGYRETGGGGGGPELLEAGG
uniref:Uncharacterized protein n=1 Tax=Oryza meridionalis TaxID=40149 RepID=A0A0E0DP78_9ORYZ